MLRRGRGCMAALEAMPLNLDRLPGAARRLPAEAAEGHPRRYVIDAGYRTSGSNPGSKLSETHSNSENRASLCNAEREPTGLKCSGWGPGGRRFKSCLPDPRKALLARGFRR